MRSFVNKAEAWSGSRAASAFRCSGRYPIETLKIVARGADKGRRGCGVSELGWQRAFEDPIPLPGGPALVTFKDAGNYITKASEGRARGAEWQAAMEALILVATSGGPTMFARIGVMQALTVIKSAGIALDLEAPPRKRQGTPIEVGLEPSF